jgi:hypothetical protein
MECASKKKLTRIIVPDIRQMVSTTVVSLANGRTREISQFSSASFVSPIRDSLEESSNEPFTDEEDIWRRSSKLVTFFKPKAQ